MCRNLSGALINATPQSKSPVTTPSCVLLAFLAVSEGTASVQRSSRYRPDGFTESIKLYRAGSRNVLQGLVRDNLGHFTERKVRCLRWSAMFPLVCILVPTHLPAGVLSTRRALLTGPSRGETKENHFLPAVLSGSVWDVCWLYTRRRGGSIRHPTRSYKQTRKHVCSRLQVVHYSPPGPFLTKSPGLSLLATVDICLHIPCPEGSGRDSAGILLHLQQRHRGRARGHGQQLRPTLHFDG